MYSTVRTFAGHLLISGDKKLNGLKKALIIMAAGILSLALGKLWSLSFPIIKNLWTSSFVLYAGGWSLILLSLFYLVIDVWDLKSGASPSCDWFELHHHLHAEFGIIDFEQMGRYFFGGLATSFQSLPDR